MCYPKIGRPLERRASAESDDLTQHPEAIVEKTHFAALGMIPAHGNFAQTQAGMTRQIEQLDVESEAVNTSGLQNWAANIEAKCFEAALRVPKRQAGRDPHQ